MQTKFREYREAARMRQDEVADKIGVDRSAVAKWETGRALPRADKLLGLSRLYNCTTDQLLGVDRQAQ
jgi:transcriptional regulator with XRE-family HTH domain